MYHSFRVSHKSCTCNARVGVLACAHGEVHTPAFVFCATKATLKCVTPSMAKCVDTSIILANTYHLMVNGGANLMARAGGIHKFMGWDGPMFTDSGGFQIFSLGHGSVADEIKRRQSSDRKRSLVKVTPDGAIFRSHIDGARYYLTPEKSMQVQRDIGADFVFALDECTPFNVDKTYTERSMHVSHSWETRSAVEFARLQRDNSEHKQALYGIIQGGIYEDLRRISVDFITQQDFFGVGIGGSLGSHKAQMYEIVNNTCSMIPPSKPRHLLGIGSVEDIISLVRSGIDTFDCVHPTRIARHGTSIVRCADNDSENSKESIVLSNNRFKEDQRPLDSNCHCSTCNNFSRSYIHYLLRISDPLAMTLLTVHNMAQMNSLMTDIRHAIVVDKLDLVNKIWLKG